MLECSTSIASAQAKRNFAQDLSKDPITLSLDIEIFQRYRSVIFTFVLCENSLWQKDQATQEKGGYCGISLQKSRFKVLIQKNVSHS